MSCAVLDVKSFTFVVLQESIVSRLTVCMLTAINLNDHSEADVLYCLEKLFSL